MSAGVGREKVEIVWPPVWFKVIKSFLGWPFSKGLSMTQGHKPHWFPVLCKTLLQELDSHLPPITQSRFRQLGTQQKWHQEGHLLCHVSQHVSLKYFTVMKNNAKKPKKTLTSLCHAWKSRWSCHLKTADGVLNPCYWKQGYFWRKKKMKEKKKA